MVLGEYLTCLVVGPTLESASQITTKICVYSFCDCWLSSSSLSTITVTPLSSKSEATDNHAASSRTWNHCASQLAVVIARRHLPPAAPPNQFDCVSLSLASCQTPSKQQRLRFLNLNDWSQFPISDSIPLLQSILDPSLSWV